MKSLIERPRPGDFRAVCKKPRWATESELPPGTDLDALRARWDRKLTQTVYEVRCALDTTDRATFEQHMVEVHKVSLARELNHHRGHTGFSTKPWKAPRLTEDGKPWTEKEAKGRTHTCPTCGLVDEIDTTYAAALWWDEHLRGCALVERQAS